MSQPFLALVLGFAGLFAASVVAFVAPRLAAGRVQAEVPLPSRLALIPLIGPWLTVGSAVLATIFELILAGTLAALAIHFGDSRKLLFAAIFTVLLALIVYIDFQHRLVLNILSLPGTVLAIILTSFWPGIGIGSALLGALVGLSAFAVLQVLGRGALGSGDTKLAMLIGAMTGLPNVLSALFLGVVIAGLAALFLLVVLRRSRKEFFAYGPYLAAGAVLSFFLL